MLSLGQGYSCLYDVRHIGGCAKRGSSRFGFLNAMNSTSGGEEIEDWEFMAFKKPNLEQKILLRVRWARQYWKDTTGTDNPSDEHDNAR